jgi:hypothetical protein
MILSIDVGLRNLAFCCMSSGNKSDFSTYNIELWKVYNTLDSDDYKCESTQKNGKICGRKCGFKYKNSDQKHNFTYCCKTHFPKTKTPTLQNTFKKKMIDSYLLQDIAKIVLAKLDEIFDENTFLGDVKQIIIELQPKINQKMKFTSHIIYGKLVELYKHTNTTIRFVRASQKLKAYTGPVIECKLKSSYSRRKWLSIQYTKWFLETKFSQEQKEKWLLDLLNCTKQDDKCDTFLMVINAMHGIPTKQFKHKNGNQLK